MIVAHQKATKLAWDPDLRERTFTYTARGFFVRDQSFPNVTSISGSKMVKLFEEDRRFSVASRCQHSHEYHNLSSPLTGRLAF